MEGARIDGLSAKNRFYRIELDEEGNLREIFDKEFGKNL